jgi:hypothetical protein
MHELQPNPFGLHLIVVKPSAEVDEPKRGIVLFSPVSYVQSKKSRSAEEMKLNELIALFLPTRDLQPMCFSMFYVQRLYVCCSYICRTRAQICIQSRSTGHPCQTVVYSLTFMSRRPL